MIDDEASPINSLTLRELRMLLTTKEHPQGLVSRNSTESLPILKVASQ
jgi:hypothetical protein